MVLLWPRINALGVEATSNFLNHGRQARVWLRLEGLAATERVREKPRQQHSGPIRQFCKDAAHVGNGELPVM